MKNVEGVFMSTSNSSPDAAAGPEQDAPAADSGGRRICVLCLVRLALVVAILAVGVGGFMWLGKLRTKPKVRPPAALLENVRVQVVEPRTVQLTIQGYGTARPVRVSVVSAQVSGRIVEVAASLEAGELVEAGEVLMQIEPDDYAAAVARGAAEVARLEAEIKRLQEDHEFDQERVENARIDRDLARRDYERVKRLYQQENVGSEREVDRAQQALTQKETALIAVQSDVATYAARLQGFEAQLQKAQADAGIARRNLERCTIAAPFAGRIESAAAEVGQFVNTGQAVCAIADHTQVEIPVALESDRAARALGLAAAGEDHSLHWFTVPDRMPVRIVWTEQPDVCAWDGVISRVERFDESTRTLVLIAVPEVPATAEARELPLVAGMFCTAEISGRTLPAAVVIPREALQFSGSVFVVDDDNRLRSQAVDISHSMGNDVVVRDGLRAGDRVVLQRLPRGVDGMEVRVLDTAQENNQP
jgi:multidrug efflux system membrane fusion protein